MVPGFAGSSICPKMEQGRVTGHRLWGAGLSPFDSPPDSRKPADENRCIKFADASGLNAANVDRHAGRGGACVVYAAVPQLRGRDLSNRGRSYRHQRDLSLRQVRY